ncbi:MAG: EF-Tu/IF-2/RF-3 family GTPase [Myxococcota bacterium]
MTHYYEHVGAATVRIEQGALAVGDIIHIRGHTTDYYQPVERLERDHNPVEQASAGEEIALQVSQRVRENDAVHRLR